MESENDIGDNEMAVRVRWEVPHQSLMYVLELTLAGVLFSDKGGLLWKYRQVRMVSDDSHSGFKHFLIEPIYKVWFTI